MASVTWIGEDQGDVPGPSFTTCYGRKFHKGQPVEITDEDTLKRARGNPFFDVDGEHASPPRDDTDDEPVLAPEFIKANEANPDGEQVETDINKMKIAQLRELAGMRGLNAFGLTKPELRTALVPQAD